MARKLPWTASTSANENPLPKASSTNPRPTKKVKTELKEKDRKSESSSLPIKPESAQQDRSVPPLKDNSQARVRDGRSQSTSPPPAPPPIELMRPGLDEDDIYMLVEDEFQAIAQSYTAHLHHAEYKRLMKLAREKKAEQQKAGTDNLGGQGIPNSVSGETRQRLKRGLLSERQSSGLKGMLGNGLSNAGGDDDSDEEEAREAVLAREEKKVGDMWAGTALGGLMSWDRSQEKTSLKGLDRIGGETRASRGFGPSRQKDVDVVQQANQADAQQAKKKSKTIAAYDRKQESEQSNEDKPVVLKTSRNNTSLDRKQVPAICRTKPAIERSSSNSDIDIQPQIGMKKIKVESRLSNPAKSKYRNFIDSLDDFDEAAFEATQAANQSESPEKSHSRQPSGQTSKKQKKDRKDRLDEVPRFLI